MAPPSLALMTSHILVFLNGAMPLQRCSKDWNNCYWRCLAVWRWPTWLWIGKRHFPSDSLVIMAFFFLGSPSTLRWRLSIEPFCFSQCFNLKNTMTRMVNKKICCVDGSLYWIFFVLSRNKVSGCRIVLRVRRVQPGWVWFINMGIPCGNF